MNRLKLIHGTNEITKISPNIQKIIDYVDNSRFSLKELINCSELITLACRSYNFEMYTSTGIAFVGNRQVIKIGYFTRNPPNEKYRVPTVIYSINDTVEWGVDFVLAIQPKIVLITEDEFTTIKKQFKNITRTTDIHSDNIGNYKGEFKLFDW